MPELDPELVVRVQDLAKAYRIGVRRDGPDHTLAALGRLAVAPLRNLRALAGGNTYRKQDPSLHWALRSVSFDVRRGDVLGVIGHNGAGKSTLLKVLSRITRPTSGRAWVRGRVSSLLEVGTGFHPELSGRENVYMNGTILGMRRSEIDARFDEIVDFAGVEKFLETPIKRYSSGMKVRLAFAVAAFLEPDLLIIDEVLAVGDPAFQTKCISRMTEVAASGRTILFVSHNLGVVRTLCNRAVLLERGGARTFDRVDDGIGAYLAGVRAHAGDLTGPGVHRTGRGAARFSRLAVGPAGGEPGAGVPVGGEAEVTLEVDAREAQRGVALGLWFTSSEGTRLFACLTRLQDADFSLETGVNRFRCRLGPLNLLPGRYYLTCSVDGVHGIEDRVEYAAQLDVVDDRFFASGRMPPRKCGDLVVGQSWTQEPAP